MIGDRFKTKGGLLVYPLNTVLNFLIIQGA